MQREADQFRSQGKRIGFVPTMGFFHEGHLSLIRKAVEISDAVIVSLFVNPIQFGAGEDFEDYPRDEDRDRRLAEENGCDVLFRPSTEYMYPHGFVTSVTVESLTEILCGASRPGHFRGVTTVVTKLFNIVKPHVAVFGQKDAQQAAVIERMTRDLNHDIEIVVAPIVREPDGLAMSSRNMYLTSEERKDAPVLYHSLQMAHEMIASGERRTKAIIEAMTKLIRAKASVRIDYVSIVDRMTLEPLDTLQQGGLIAVAAWVGKARLIDNMIVSC
jgi:pantoate--beta-alanine ligase